MGDIKIWTIIGRNNGIGVQNRMRSKIVYLDVIDGQVLFHFGDAIHVADKSKQIGVIDKTFFIGLEVGLLIIKKTKNLEG